MVIFVCGCGIALATALFSTDDRKGQVFKATLKMINSNFKQLVKPSKNVKKGSIMLIPPLVKTSMSALLVLTRALMYKNVKITEETIHATV